MSHRDASHQALKEKLEKRTRQFEDAKAAIKALQAKVDRMEGRVAQDGDDDDDEGGGWESPPPSNEPSVEPQNASNEAYMEPMTVPKPETTTETPSVNTSHPTEGIERQVHEGGVSKETIWSLERSIP